MTQKRQVKKCKNCNQDFRPFSTLENTCSPKCKRKLAEKRAQKREQSKARKLEINKASIIYDDLEQERRNKLIKKAQEISNRLVKLRDWGLPCVSCGAEHRPDFQAGHFYSVGAHPELRLELDNIHGQCQECNNSFTVDKRAVYMENIYLRYGKDYLSNMACSSRKVERKTNSELEQLIRQRRSECNMLRNQITEGE